MSSMLEQAIADAAALREQAIKNAEQSVLDKYSKQIKEAVNQMLEQDDAPQRAESIISEVEEELMQEEEAAATGGGETETASFEAPPAWDSRFDDISSRLTAMVDNLPEDADGMIELDLGDFSVPADELAAVEGTPEEPVSDLGDLGGEEPAEEGGDDLDSLLGDLEAEPEGDALQEVFEVLGDILEQTLILMIQVLHPVSFLDLLLYLLEPGTLGVAGEEVVLLLGHGVDGDGLPGDVRIPHLTSSGGIHPRQVGQGGHQGPVRVGAPDHHVLPVVRVIEPARVPRPDPPAQLVVSLHTSHCQLTQTPGPVVVEEWVCGIWLYGSSVTMSPQQVDLNRIIISIFSQSNN